MEAENRFEYRKLKITITTPVHIGDENTLNPKEYFYDRRSGLVYFINKPEWHRFIIKHKLFDKYERYMSARAGGQNLLSWLGEHGYALKDVQQVIMGRSRTETDSFCASLNTVKLHIRQADGSVYLPGSSIKGFLRTALLYRLLQTEAGLKKSCWDNLLKESCKSRKDFERGAKEKVNQLETDLLHRLKLRDNDKDIASKNAVCSVMRGLSISDACASGEVKTALLQKWDISLRSLRDKNFGRPNPLPLFRESVLPGAVFCCDLKLDKAMLREAGIENAGQLLQAAQEFYDFTLDLWRSCDFGSEGRAALSSAGEGNMFLGGGSGFHTKTLIWALAPNKEEALAFTRTWLDRQFARHKHQQLDTKLAPRTLKIVGWSDKRYLQGTARAELL